MEFEPQLNSINLTRFDSIRFITLVSRGSICRLRRAMGTPDARDVVNHVMALLTVSSTFTYGPACDDEEVLGDIRGKNTVEKTVVDDDEEDEEEDWVFDSQDARGT
jgi:hypothetical protein